ncbi:hypothetical protein [Nocardia sp. NPDC127526]|uniref:hypothetical protein n=1 Tax=Nocardia sp. NPDC127526 TaxID=3345393 RepID=UPI0036263F12
MSDDATKKTEDEAAEADATQPGGAADESATTDLSKKADAPAADAKTEDAASEDAESTDAKTEVLAKAEEPKPAAKPDFSKKSDAPKADKPKPAAKAPKSAAASSDSKPGFPLVPVIAAFAAGVLLVAAVATGVVLWKKGSDNQKELDARDGATAAACDFGKAVSNYDAKNLDDYFTRVKDLSTGQWLEFFGGASDALKEAMASVQAKSTLDEIHCAWESGSDDKAKVVLILTQVRSNGVAAGSDMLTVPGVADMVKENGKWKVANFDSPAMKGLTGSGTPAPTTEAPAPTTQAPAPGN